MNHRNPLRSRYAVAVAAVMLSAGIPALQAEERTSSGLPGVDRMVADQTPVRPVGEPIIATPRADADGFVRIGDWDVKISGSVTIDIGHLRRARAASFFESQRFTAARQKFGPAASSEARRAFFGSSPFTGRPRPVFISDATRHSADDPTGSL